MSEEPTMVERVARALARTQSGTLFREECTAAQLDAFGYIKAARAAIEAMRTLPYETQLELQKVVNLADEAGKFSFLSRHEIEKIWQAGIDAALNQGETG